MYTVLIHGKIKKDTPQGNEKTRNTKHDAGGKGKKSSGEAGPTTQFRLSVWEEASELRKGSLIEGGDLRRSSANSQIP